MPQIEPNPLTEYWGKRIREAREDRGLTITGLAQLLDVDQGNLSRIEAGKQRASEEMRIRIATGLGCHVGDLFDYPDLQVVEIRLGRRLGDEPERLGA